tara:strand:- start:871 stop:1188 length:318 start_codon:yes stop_codon:yes gene_type:complete
MASIFRKSPTNTTFAGTEEEVEARIERTNLALQSHEFSKTIRGIVRLAHRGGFTADFHVQSTTKKVVFKTDLYWNEEQEVYTELPPKLWPKIWPPSDTSEDNEDD